MLFLDKKYISPQKKEKENCFFHLFKTSLFSFLEDAITSSTCSTSLVNGNGYYMNDSAITASSELLTPTYFGCLAFNARHIDVDDTDFLDGWCAG